MAMTEIQRASDGRFPDARVAEGAKRETEERKEWDPMMRHLLEGMKSLEDQELRYARKEHGDSFGDFADGHLALVEEIQEAQEEWTCVQVVYAHMMAVYRREGRVDSSVLAKIESKALHASCELVQVATVARKMRESEGCCGNGEKSLCEDMP